MSSFLEFEVILLQPFGCWDYRCLSVSPLQLLSIVLHIDFIHISHSNESEAL